MGKLSPPQFGPRSPEKQHTTIQDHSRKNVTAHASNQTSAMVRLNLNNLPFLKLHDYRIIEKKKYGSSYSTIELGQNGVRSRLVVTSLDGSTEFSAALKQSNNVILKREIVLYSTHGLHQGVEMSRQICR